MGYGVCLGRHFSYELAQIEPEKPPPGAAFSLPKPLSDTLPYPVFRSYLPLLAYRTVLNQGGK